jgi:hypothetical protein
LFIGNLPRQLCGVFLFKMPPSDIRDIYRKQGWNDSASIEADIKAGGWKTKVPQTTLPTSVAPTYTGPTTAQLIEQQKGQGEQFMGKLSSALPAIRSRLEGDLNLPSLRDSAFNLTQTLKSIPGNENKIADQVGISAPRLAKRVAQKQSELAPSVQDAVSQAQFAEGEFTKRYGYETQPYQFEFDLLTDRFAREATGYSSEQQRGLDLLLAKMNEGLQLTLAEQNRASQLAESEKEYERQKELMKIQTDESVRLAQEQEKIKQASKKSSSGSGAISYLKPNMSTNQGAINTLWNS